MSEETVKGPIMDAIKEKIAEMIQNPQQFIALVQMLVSLFPKKDGPFAASGDLDPAVAELIDLCQQAGE